MYDIVMAIVVMVGPMACFIATFATTLERKPKKRKQRRERRQEPPCERLLEPWEIAAIERECGIEPLWKPDRLDFKTDGTASITAGGITVDTLYVWRD